MSSESEEMVTFRLAPRDRAAIQRLLRSGEFRNRSDFLRYAVKATLAAYGETPTIPQPLDLDLDTPALRRGLSSSRFEIGDDEAVELPPQEPARAKARGRSSTRKGLDL